MSRGNNVGTHMQTKGLGGGRDPYKEYEPRRYKGRCRFYSYDGDKCNCNYSWRFEKRCLGSWKCIEYESITDEEFLGSPKKIRKKKKQEAKSSGMKGAAAGTDAEASTKTPVRRYKGRCRFYSYDGDRCSCKSSPCYKSKCTGSGGCSEYKAVTEGVFINRQKKARSQKIVGKRICRLIAAVS